MIDVSGYLFSYSDALIASFPAGRVFFNQSGGWSYTAPKSYRLQSFLAGDIIDDGEGFGDIG